MKFPTPSVSDLLRRTMTPTERAVGRFMRAPDGHDGGEGGDGKVEESLLGAAEVAAKEGEDAAAKEAAAKVAADASAKEAADKAAADAKAIAAPDKYDLKVPEGSTFDAEAFSAVEPTLREINLSNDQAQKLVDAYAGKVMPALTKRANDAILNKAADQRKEWADAFEKDPDIGGAKKGDTLSAAARVFDHYGLKKGEGLRLLLDESGLGNHPDLIRVFAKIGADMAEGGFERGDVSKHPKAPEERMYGPEFQPK